jgi:hypothetical protein
MGRPKLDIHGPRTRSCRASREKIPLNSTYDSFLAAVLVLDVDAHDLLEASVGLEAE